MATQIGVIKQVSGLVVAVDENGTQRVLKAGDALFFGEVIKTSSAASKAVVSMDNGKDVTILGNESIKLDNSLLANADNKVADVSDLQKALLDGKDLSNLEETAAGGGNAAGGGDGVSLGAATFEHGGHYSNISADTSAINPLGAGSFAGPVDNVGGGASGKGEVGDLIVKDETAPEVKEVQATPVDTDGKDGKAERIVVTAKSDEPNAPVVVTIGGKKFPGTTDADGKVNVTITDKDVIDRVQKGDEVKVEVTDPSGNKGEGKGEVGDLIVKDETAPETPEVTFVEDGNVDKILSKTENSGDSDSKHTTVKISTEDAIAGDKIDYSINGSKQPSHVLTEAEVQKGFIEVKVPVGNGGDEIRVEAKIVDQAGNASGSKDASLTVGSWIDLKLGTIEIDESSKPGGGAAKQENKHNGVISLTDGNDNMIVNTGLFTHGSVLNAGKGNDHVLITGALGSVGTIWDSSIHGTVNLGEGGSVITKASAISIDSNVPNARFVIKNGAGEVIGEGTTNNEGKFDGDLKLSKAIMPKDKITAEITDKAGNVASDTEIVANVSGLEAGGRYYNNLLEIGTDIDHGEVNAGAGNDKVVTGVRAGSGHITGHSHINLGDGDNELIVKTNIDDSIVKAGSGDDIVTVGQWQKFGQGWITDGSTIKLGDGNNTLTVGTNIEGSIVETGKGIDHIKVGNYIHNSTVKLGAGDDTLEITKQDMQGNDIDGGAGYDKLIITKPGATINLDNIAKHANNFEEINISNTDQKTTVNVTLKDVMDITDSDNVLAITGESGDKVSLAGGRSAGWKEAASGDHAKGDYRTYTNTDDNGNTVFVQIKNEVDVLL